MKRCQAKNKNGDQCRNNAIPGTNHCYLKSHGAGETSLFKRALNWILNNWAGTLLVIILGVAPIAISYHESKMKSTSGVLKIKQSAIKKQIAIGGIRIVLETENNVIVRDNGDPVLTVQLRENKLYVSSIIRGSDGELNR
jgi:hypothetical protein